MRLRPLVLCYHALSDGWHDPLSVRPEEFERQLRVARHARRAGSIEDAARGRPVLHLTFDDAYRSVLNGLPAIERNGLSATIFACAGYGDGRRLAIPELAGARGEPSAELETLTWDDLRGLTERGVAVGSHTSSHPHLTTLSDAELDRELGESKSRIEDELGTTCRYLAYPYGENDARVREAAARAGYEAAFGLPGSGDRFSLPRVGLYRRDSLARAGAKIAAATVLGRGFG